MSKGEIVDINEDKIRNLETMQTEIQDTITYTREFADDMQVTLALAIRDLQSVVADYNPSLIDIDTDIAEIDRPVFPTEPIFTAYSSDIRDVLILKVKQGIVDGGTGLTEAVYSSIIAREKEIRRTNQDESYRTALAAVGSRGFHMPSGQVAALQAKVTTEIIKSNQDSVNNITNKDFELAQNNSQFIITAGIELEKTLVSAWSTEEETKVNVHNANIQGVVGEYDALSKWSRIEIDRIKVEADIAIKNEELNLSAYTAMTALAEKVAEAIAGIATQSIASALGAVNTSMSNSYSGSEGRNEGWNHGESLSENHSYSA